MTEESNYQLVRRLRPKKIILPVIFGAGAIVWLVSKEFSTDSLSKLIFTWKSALWILVAWLFMLGRDLGYIIRLRILTDRRLSWLQAFRVIMLWEFTSAVTPSTVGGTAMAVVFLNKEGMTVGRSTAVVLATSFLDELYFVLMMPLMIIIVGNQALFTTSLQGTGISFLNKLALISWIGYSLILIWVLLVGYGLFLNPRTISSLINRLFSLPFIRRWEESARKAGSDIIESSNELKKRPFMFWLKAFTATFLSWTSRYWVVNAILVAFFTVNNHFLIFARQLVTWIMMIISPSPGGSGFAELILGRYITDQIPFDPVVAGGLALAIAIIWRMLSYYPYLIAGAFIVPSWIESKFVKRPLKNNEG